jgi:hypothetical protein
LIGDTGLAASAQSSIEITPSSNKYFSAEEGDLFIKMHKILQFFLELLQVAGGDLNISKYACFTIFHRWSGGRATLLKTHESHLIMTVKLPTLERLRLWTNQAHRFLDWMITTDGKSTTQFKVLKTKARIFSGAILQSRMQ